MNKILIKQSFLAGLASSLAGLAVYYIFAFWFESDSRLNIIEFLLLAFFLMPICIGSFLIVFSLYFLSDYYKENPSVKLWKIFLFLFLFTGLATIILDEAYFLVNDDIPKAFVRAYKALDESYKDSGKKTLQERTNDLELSIEEIGNYAPWFQNMISLLIFLPIVCGISVVLLRRSGRKKNINYV